MVSAMTTVNKVESIEDVTKLLSNMTYNSLVAANMFDGNLSIINWFVNQFEQRIQDLYNPDVALKLSRSYGCYTKPLLEKVQSPDAHKLSFSQKEYEIIQYANTLYNLKEFDQKVKELTHTLIMESLKRYKESK